MVKEKMSKQKYKVRIYRVYKNNWVLQWELLEKLNHSKVAKSRTGIMIYWRKTHEWKKNNEIKVIGENIWEI